MQEEFQRQVNNLLNKNYPELAGLSREEFLELLKPFEEKVSQLGTKEVDLEKGFLPFVIVIKSELIPAEKAMALIDFHGKPGIEKLFPHKPETFKTREDVQIPQSKVYLLIDIDRGKETLNITPEIALKTITDQGRSPLTIDEGISILIHYPDFLQKNNCYSLLASRTDDQRVPAIWISEKAPKLGWCWDRNPHTWLGSASCAARI